MNQCLQKCFAERSNEKGLALLITIFIIALATILITELGHTTWLDQKSSRSFSDSVKADFCLKSAVNFGRLLLEIPKEDEIQDYYLGEEWAQIDSFPLIPIPCFTGNLRVSISNEEGKIDINSIATSKTVPQIGGQTSSTDTFWKSALREIFAQAGFSEDSYDPSLKRTIGNNAFSSSQQVAIINDWLDRDDISHRDQGFDGQGIESGAAKDWFYNRPLVHLSELQLIPGMTRERIAFIAPYVRVSPRSGTFSTTKINVNTAPLQVLLAIGFSEGEAHELIDERINLPITNSILTTLVTGNTQLRRFTSVKSSQFSIIAKAEMPTVTRWAKVIVKTRGGGANRSTQIESFEIH